MGGRSARQKMPQEIFIKGCGGMACCTYAEVARAMDRAFAAPSRQPLPTDAVFAALAPGGPAPKGSAPRPGSEPGPNPG
jgi:hypothetical protein